MSTVPHIQSEPPRPSAALAFMLAPGIAAMVGALVFCAMILLDPSPMGGDAGFRLFSAFVVSSVAFAMAGYPTAAIVAVPVYLVLPERARSCFALVVPLAGLIAAAPWLPLAAPWQHGSSSLPLLGIPFALGCVGGIAFLFIRRPRAPAEGDEALPVSTGPAAALSCGS